MEYLKLFEDYSDINSICRKLGIKNYTINQNGTVDVTSHVDISNMRLDKIPLQFGKIEGYFNCSKNNLTSLKGSPTIVGGCFYCHENNLTSLEYSPEKALSLYCSDNNLTNLEGCTDKLLSFKCNGRNNLISLKGGPTDVVDVSVFGYSLPDLIKDNYKYMKHILKWQGEYSIWRNDDTLDEFRFNEMMMDIMNDINESGEEFEEHEEEEEESEE